MPARVSRSRQPQAGKGGRVAGSRSRVCYTPESWGHGRDTAATAGASPPSEQPRWVRRAHPGPFTRHSRTGMSTVSPSWATSTGPLYSSRACASSRPKGRCRARLDRCVRMSRCAPACCATRAASRAVEWRVSSARSWSSSEKVDSWMSRSASLRRLRQRCAGSRVPGEDQPAAGARRAQHVLRLHRAARRAAITDSPRCSRPKSGPSRHAQRLGLLQVEAPGRVVLLQHVRQRVDAVVHAHRVHRVAVPLHAVAVLQLDDLHREGRAAPRPGAPPGAAAASPGAGRTGASAFLAPHHPQRAQEADDSQVVVGVEVGEEDGVHREAGAEAHHLPLAALAAVEEQQVRVRLHRQAGEVAVQRRLRGRGSEEGEPEEGHAGVAHDVPGPLPPFWGAGALTRRSRGRQAGRLKRSPGQARSQLSSRHCPSPVRFSAGLVLCAAEKLALLTRRSIDDSTAR